MNKSLIEKALDASKRAYAPYSKFSVGAALLTKEGKVYTGCNIENASYSATVCAERVAFFKAISEGEREFVSIALVATNEKGDMVLASPCGSCRQVMAEFCTSESFEIVMAQSLIEYKSMKLGDLLPCAFSAEDVLR